MPSMPGMVLKRRKSIPSGRLALTGSKAVLRNVLSSAVMIVRSCALTGSPAFTAALFAGPTASSLGALPVATTTFLDVNFAGLLNPANVVIAGAPAGTTYFFDIEIYDSRATSVANAHATVNPANPTGNLSEYAGESGVFSAVLQTVASPIYQTAAPVSSTMVHNSTFVPNDYAGYPGYFGSIKVDAAIVPDEQKIFSCKRAAGGSEDGVGGKPLAAEAMIFLGS